LVHHVSDLARFLQRKLSPLAGNLDTFVKNSEHFIQTLKTITIQKQNTLVSFGVVHIFIDVPVDGILQIIRNLHSNDQTLPLHCLTS
jgi:hypothetical protein